MSFQYPRVLTIRALLTLVIFVTIIGGFCVLNFIIKPPEVLYSERRVPASIPNLSLQNIISAKYMNQFEDFVSDNFVYRDELRTVRAATVFHLFFQTDKSGLYYDGAVGAGKFERLNEQALRQTAAKIRKITDDLDGLNIYYSYIPDKDIYANIDYPGFDTDKVLTILLEELPELTLIELRDTLSAEDFYRTDLHWDQVKLGNVVDKLGAAMGFNVDMDSYKSVIVGEFQGVYTGQLALPVSNDEMVNIVLGDSVSARYLNNKSFEWEYGPVYDTKAFSGRDPYDIFLSGVEPLIVLENPNSTTERELYLFRDSFSSSLAPLLTQAYRKITLIDLRYIDYSNLSNFVSFERGLSDVLFLYSSQVLNNPGALLIK
ncbi:DHHW family protein [Tissierella sp. Yu-01]|uniref:DHHW family protein n=1 Tax=Tissierella sp. Yu-01 TaxID=3035694 RepID=UPI00240DEC17|nr:DHHW family protein [Tissierella sp. Yu-01]WFA08030.1 DHHW family protein [Tissierella sp. Yu-01]